MKSYLAEDGEEADTTSDDNEPPHVYDDVSSEENAVVETEESVDASVTEET